MWRDIPAPNGYGCRCANARRGIALPSATTGAVCRRLPGSAAANGMGMIGMRARARSTGGDVTVRSRPGAGVEIEVRAPDPVTKDESKDPHPVS